jgi:hypothetical protein
MQQALCDLFDAWVADPRDDAAVADALRRVWAADGLATMEPGGSYSRGFGNAEQSLKVSMPVRDRLVTYTVESKAVGGEYVVTGMEISHHAPPLTPAEMQWSWEELPPARPRPPATHRPVALTGAGLNEDHEAANKDCPECWGSYPKPCECGGLVHAEFEDESLHADGDVSVILRYACDRCGEDWEEATSDGE